MMSNTPNSTPDSPKNYNDFVIDRVEAFQDKFGARHLYLAMHAAFPLSLPPELVYLIRDNFQYDSKGRFLDIPFEAVPDLLLSELCQEVGHEVYQMEPEMRQYLLMRLRESSRFGEARIEALATFIGQYYGPDLSGVDWEKQNVAESQLWASQLQTESSQGVAKLSELLSYAQNEGNTDLQYRLSNLLNQYEAPDTPLQQLKTFAKGNALNLMGLKKEANETFAQMQQTSPMIEIAGQGFEIPIINLEENFEQQFNPEQFVQTRNVEYQEIEEGGKENENIASEAILWLIHHPSDKEAAFELDKSLGLYGLRNIKTKSIEEVRSIQDWIYDGIMVLEGNQNFEWIFRQVELLSEQQAHRNILGYQFKALLAKDTQTNEIFRKFTDDWTILDIEDYQVNPFLLQFAEQVKQSYLKRTAK